MKRLLIGILLTVSHANASTFVGNGGGAGDVELAVTKTQIRETFAAVERRKDDDLDWCTCKESYRHRSVCGALNGLEPAQAKYCSKQMVTQSGAMLALVDDPNVRIEWTRDPIEVMIGDRRRAVDAVTDPAKRMITVNLERFLTLKPFERVFLLTHEYLHLAKFEGKPLDDNAAVGPFTGDEGGRRLLNAMGAAAAVTHFDLPGEVRSYNAKLRRSQSWKSRWIDVSGGSSEPSGGSDGTFVADKFNRSSIGLRYTLGNFVLGVAYRRYQNDFKALTTIDVSETIDVASLSLGYRFFFFRDPMTFWGQSHMILSAGADYYMAKQELKDPFTSSEDEAKVFGGHARVEYFLPIMWGFWGFGGAAYEWRPYSYDSVNVKYKGGSTSSYLGVSYGF